MNLIRIVTGSTINNTGTLPSSRTSVQSEQQHSQGDLPPEPTGEQAAQVRGAAARRETISILILGRSGSGKTYLIDYACKTTNQGETQSSRQAMTDVESRYTRHSGVTFKLIDTPGFDNLAMSDSEVLTKIANYCLNPSRVGRGINGIIYIHPAGDALQGRYLRRNLELLSDLFLGETGLARLTIFVPLSNKRGIDPAAIVDEMRRPGSVFSSACAAGAKLMTPKADCPGFIEAIMFYVSYDPILLPIQQDSPSNFLSRLEESTWYYEKESAQRRVKDLETQYRAKLRELESSLNNKDLKLMQYQEAYSESEKLRANQREAETALRLQLQQAQQEFALLRLQLRLHDSFEQSEIIQDLKDLNRDIDDIGRLISADLADNHVQTTFGRDLADVTALDARDLRGVKSLLGHVDGKSSLVVSSEGAGMDVETFFDLSTRTLLCTFLIKKIFQPFHPGIDASQNEVLLAVYEEIQKQEPQSVAGKWRASTFKSVYRPERPDTAVDHLNAFTHEFVRDLGSLLTLFFGRRDAILERGHFNRLRQLITSAWDWNSKLKGEVIMLGDFGQIAYIPPSVFDAVLMEEFEPNPRIPQAESVLGTVALGLVSRQAVGGGQPPAETLVCKALVATNNMYK